LEDAKNAAETHRPEEIVAKLRQVDVTPFTYYRWRKEFGGLKSDHSHLAVSPLAGPS
jgi:hypothetical protein